MPLPHEVVIVDYGMGNLYNLNKVLCALGAAPVISSDPQVIAKADRLILPGVGAFEDGIRQLKESSLAEAIHNFIKSGKPLLGICLGMQLLMESSEEGGLHQGLSLVKGSVVRFLEPLAGGVFFKIPHIGWNSLHRPSAHTSWAKTICADINPDDYVYFVHSYTVCPSHENVILAQTNYGRQVFCSALSQGNIHGCQFHPEISGPVGLNILKQFLNL